MPRISYIDYHKLQQRLKDFRLRYNTEKRLAEILIPVLTSKVGQPCGDEIRREAAAAATRLFSELMDTEFKFASGMKVKSHPDPVGLYVGFQYRVSRDWETGYVVACSGPNVLNRDLEDLKEMFKRAETFLFATDPGEQHLKKFVVQYNKGADLCNDALEKLGPTIVEVLP